MHGGWLTEKGKAALEALNREADNGFEALSGESCIHGYAVKDELDDCPECSKLNA